MMTPSPPLSSYLLLISLLCVLCSSEPLRFERQLNDEQSQNKAASWKWNYLFGKNENKPTVISEDFFGLSKNTLDDEWIVFKKKHGKSYQNDAEEKLRKTVFHTNYKRVQLHNYLHKKKVVKFTLKINEYSDMDHSEFVSTMNGYGKGGNTTHPAVTFHDAVTYMSPLVKLDLPKQVDWRKKGYVTPVKNQGQCGSCWSFSTTGALEGQHFRQTGRLISLSEQNLVDCSVAWGNHGCQGGLMDNAFQYIKDNGGIDTESSYPYEADQENCHYKFRESGAEDTGYVDIPQGNEDKLQEAVATVGPVSVAIDASHASFMQYSQGVYDEAGCSSENLDHGVLVVGYGTTEDGEDYWLVKNSWGTSWGMSGYIKMSRNKGDQCGIASSASYPLV